MLYELKLTKPLIRVQIFKDRSFAVDCAVLFLLSIPFVPLFFFASVYSQVSLGWQASESGLYLLVFFGGFAIPVGQAVAAETGEVHQFDILYVGAAAQVRHQAPECRSLEFGGI